MIWNRKRLCILSQPDQSQALIPRGFQPNQTGSEISRFQMVINVEKNNDINFFFGFYLTILCRFLQVNKRIYVTYTLMVNNFVVTIKKAFHHPRMYLPYDRTSTAFDRADVLTKNISSWKISLDALKGNVNIFREVQQPNNYRKASKFLGWTSWKSRLNTVHILDKRHLLTHFHSEVHKTTSSKQTRSFYVRKTIQCSNFLNTIFIRVAESISRNQ